MGTSPLFPLSGVLASEEWRKSVIYTLEAVPSWDRSVFCLVRANPRFDVRQLHVRSDNASQRVPALAQDAIDLAEKSLVEDGLVNSRCKCCVQCVLVFAGAASFRRQANKHSRSE